MSFSPSTIAAFSPPRPGNRSNSALVLPGLAGLSAGQRAEAEGASRRGRRFLLPNQRERARSCHWFYPRPPNPHTYGASASLGGGFWSGGPPPPPPQGPLYHGPPPPPPPPPQGPLYHGPPPPPPPPAPLPPPPPPPQGSLIIPCRGKSMGQGHNNLTAYFTIPPGTIHGQKLKCSHHACSQGPSRFMFCRYCNDVVSAGVFWRLHRDSLCSHRIRKQSASVRRPHTGAVSASGSKGKGRHRPRTGAVSASGSKGKGRHRRSRVPGWGRWTDEEHRLFLKGLAEFGKGSWPEIAALVKSRTATQVRTHAQKHFKMEESANPPTAVVAEENDAVVPFTADASPTVDNSFPAASLGCAPHERNDTASNAEREENDAIVPFTADASPTVVDNSIPGASLGCAPHEHNDTRPQLAVYARGIICTGCGGLLENNAGWKCPKTACTFSTKEYCTAECFYLKHMCGNVQEFVPTVLEAFRDTGRIAWNLPSTLKAFDGDDVVYFITSYIPEWQRAKMRELQEQGHDLSAYAEQGDAVSFGLCIGSEKNGMRNRYSVYKRHHPSLRTLVKCVRTKHAERVETFFLFVFSLRGLKSPGRISDYFRLTEDVIVETVQKIEQYNDGKDLSVRFKDECGEYQTFHIDTFANHEQFETWWSNGGYRHCKRLPVRYE